MATNRKDLIERLLGAAVNEMEAVIRMSWHADLLREAATELGEWRELPRKIVAPSPPSMPLNLDEWEIRAPWELPEGPGWWLVAVDGFQARVRRRAPK